MRKRTIGRRTLARLATISIGAAVPVLTAVSPALALHKDDGAYAGPSLGAGLTILSFVVIPLGAFLIIAGLSVLPSALSKPRYRPGKGWEHGERWFGGPAEGEEPAAADRGTRGGASAEW